MSITHQRTQTSHSKPQVKPVEHNHTASLVGSPQRARLWIKSKPLKGNSAQSTPHRRIWTGDPVESGRTKLWKSSGRCSAREVFWVCTVEKEKLADLFTFRHLSPHFNFSFMLCCPMIYSWLLSRQAILTGRPGGESIEAGKKKSSPLSLQMYSPLFSVDDLFYYVNYQIQNTSAPTLESCLASFVITLVFRAVRGKEIPKQPKRLRWNV